VVFRGRGRPSLGAGGGGGLISDPGQQYTNAVLGEPNFQMLWNNKYSGSANSECFLTGFACRMMKKVPVTF
jgi:hypothetical protein